MDTRLERSQALTDFAAHDNAMSLPIETVVTELTKLLGATTVAAIGGVEETRAVQQWMTGRKPQRADVLRFALQIASQLAVRRNNDIARAWFYGSNPYLNDAMPIFWLRTRPLSEIQADIMAAVRAFVGRTEPDPL
jgi:hypothetical protein